MAELTFSCTVSKIGTADLNLKAFVDDTKFFDSSPTATSTQIGFSIVDDEQQHTIKFVLSGKLSSDTELDSLGNFIKDTSIVINNFTFENVECDHWINQIITYSHNSNGHGAEIQDSFGGVMGCNGTASFNFQTPIFVWLMDNM